MPTIEVLEKDEVIHVVSFSEPKFVVGREVGCDLVLEDEWISRRHLAFKKTGPNSWEVIDLNSGNGSFLGSKRIRATSIRDGDLVRLGTSHLRFRQEITQTRSRAPETVQIPTVDLALQDLADEKSKVRMLEAELDVLRLALSRQSEEGVPQASKAYGSLLNPRLLMHFHRTAQESPGLLGRGPKETDSGTMRWGFVGIGRTGDALVHVLSKLGRGNVRVLIESLVPKTRVKSHEKLVIRLADEDGAIPLAESVALADWPQIPWLGDQAGKTSDLFFLSSADVFGSGSLATARLDSLFKSVRASCKTGATPRSHMILVQDTSREPADSTPWRSILDLGLLDSVICIDRERVGNFAGDLQSDLSPFVAMGGVIDSAQRLARQKPLLGAWDDREFSTFLSQSGFSTLTCSATESMDDISQAVDDLADGGLFHGGFSRGSARRVFLLAVLGSKMADDPAVAAERVRDDFEKVGAKWPQAKLTTAVFVDSGQTLRMFGGIAGQTSCEFTSHS